MLTDLSQILLWLIDVFPHVFLWLAASFPLIGVLFLMYLNKRENGSFFAVRNHQGSVRVVNDSKVVKQRFNRIFDNETSDKAVVSKSVYSGSISGGGRHFNVPHER